MGQEFFSQDEQYSDSIHLKKCHPAYRMCGEVDRESIMHPLHDKFNPTFDSWTTYTVFIPITFGMTMW